MRIRIDDPELKRAINLNLQRLASGAVRKEKEKLAEERVARRAQAKADKKEIARLTKYMSTVVAERDGLQNYLDELLLNPIDMNPLGYAEGGSESQYFGLIEETDHAVEGCNKEIADLLNRIEILKSRI